MSKKTTAPKAPSAPKAPVADVVEQVEVMPEQVAAVEKIIADNPDEIISTEGNHIEVSEELGEKLDLALMTADLPNAPAAPRSTTTELTEKLTAELTEKLTAELTAPVASNASGKKQLVDEGKDYLVKNRKGKEFTVTGKHYNVNSHKLTLVDNA